MNSGSYVLNATKDKKERARAQTQRNLRLDRICQFYERMFYQSLYESSEFGDPVTFASSAHERAAFDAFVTQKAAEKREGHIQKEDREVIDAIMAAYDRRHTNGGHEYDSLGITVEYTGGLP